MYPRLLIVIHNLDSLVSHRLPIALAAQQSGYEVHIAYGSKENIDPQELLKKGLILHYVPIQRGGTNPMTDTKSIISLWRFFRQLRPSIVHLVTIKPVLYGGIAARLARVPAVVSAIAGLGSVFTKTTNFKIRCLQYILKPLFYIALGHTNQILITQNKDDRDRILSLSSISPQKNRLIRGSGVDVKKIPFLPEPQGTRIVAMASRLIQDKGVYEFVQAAGMLQNRIDDVRFWLIGNPDQANPTSISREELLTWHNENLIDYLGFQPNVPALYAQAHIVVLPSYGEGLPKSLIEAAACGRPVITTDMPGCRDAIEPNVTGLLVPAKNALALADAIELLLQNASIRQEMGQEARKLAEREFSIEKVVAAHLQIYQELCC